VFRVRALSYKTGARDVQTTLNYYTPLDSQPPYRHAPPHIARNNTGLDSRAVVIHDARGKEDDLGLDISGFQFVNYPSVEKDFIDEGKIKTEYYAEVEEILKKHAGAKRVVIFNHIIRRSLAHQQVSTETLPAKPPVKRVHVDETFASAPERVLEYFLPDEAERLLKGRYRIINVWRPIANPVAHEPLALADYRSVDPENDLVSVRIILPDREIYIFNLKHNPGHKWYYLSDQTPDEVILLKSFDSDVDKARLAPHSAFEDSTSPADAPQRQSIEVRALVFDTE